MERKKRKELSLKEKINLINSSVGKSQRQLAHQFGIGKTQVQCILKRKAELMDGYESNAHNERKRLCKRSPVEEINLLVWEWFQKIQQQGIRVSGPMIQERGLIYVKQLCISDTEFKASKGWLNRFRDRHNISFQTVSGESGSVSQETVSQWKDKLPDIIRGYSPEDVFNMDDTGLYYRAMPDKTLCVKGAELKGGKRLKERLTVMLCVNMTGDFEKPMVIGKSKTPRCFRNLKIETLPVQWYWNKKAWMTGVIFKDWITAFNKRMRCQDRHVILFLDNATSHPSDLHLSHVKVAFLPKNTTSVLQPLDQGIIQNMKVNYRKRMLRSVIAKIDSGDSVDADSVSKSINVLSAVQFVSASVKDVKRETVEKCFLKAGTNPSNVRVEESVDDDDDIPIAELMELMKVSRSKVRTAQEMTPEEFLGIDADIPVHEELDADWEKKLVDSFVNPKELSSSESRSEDADTPDEDDEVKESDIECEVKSHSEALKLIEQLKLYCLNKDLTGVLPHLEVSQEVLGKETVKRT